MADWPYNTTQWQKLRQMVIRDQPYCSMCREMGKLTTENLVVDHLVKVKDDPGRAFDVDNCQVLCAGCHNSIKQKAERSGKIVGSKLDGSPVDPGHHWNS